jgi:beta-galactosidase
VPRTHIIGHWNYGPDTKKTVYVVSNGETVELFLNGKSLGLGERSHGFLFTFSDVTWKAGELKAVAHYKNGTTSEALLRTAGAPAALRLTPHTGPRGFVADNADLMLVDVEVVDAAGNRVPTAFNPVTFDLKGAGQWIGGIAQMEGPYDPAKKNSSNGVFSKTLPVELGINRVLIRASGNAGKLVLSAKADGLSSASMEIAAQRAPVVKGGISSVFAEDFQRSDLSRGPTPSTPSFQPVLRTLKLASISAGSDAGDAQKSHDDNEGSTWASDGNPKNAWIEYVFEKPESPTLLSLRLTGWRLRSYPLRVTLDGKVVFEGLTPRTLGYVNLPLQVATGTHLRIALTGPTEDRDAFGKIVEVKAGQDNRVAQSVGADAVPPGWRLGIVEADILAPAQ